MSYFNDPLPPYEIVTFYDQRSFVIFEDWKDEYLDIMRREQLSALRVRGRSLDMRFLGSLKHVESLCIDRPETYSQTIEWPEGLKKLTLSGRFPFQLDLSKLTSLESLSLEWSSKVVGLKTLKNIQHIGIGSPTDSALAELTDLPSLTSLRIYKTNSAELASVGRLVGLKKLRLILARKLQGISFLAQLNNLEDLEVQDCTSFNDITLLGQLENLSELALEDVGEIVTLSPLAFLPKIHKIVVFGGKGTKVRENDFTQLMQNPALQRLFVIGRGGVDWRRSS